MNEAACPPAVWQEPDNTLNLLDIEFWLWYRKVTPKGMAHAFKIKFWETFSTPGYYDILTDNQYKIPNSNDGCCDKITMKSLSSSYIKKELKAKVIKDSPIMTHTSCTTHTL